MSRINAVIVDDEPLARGTIAKLLGGHADVTVAGEAGNGQSALALLRHLSPDLLFLDMEMPDMTGLEMLKQLPEAQRPAVIFVTSHSAFALKAFECRAVDFLLKPYSDERFHQALARARGELRQPDIAALTKSVEALLQQMPAGAIPPDAKAIDSNRLTVKSGGDIHVLKAEHIKWVEAQGDYLRIHSTTGRTLVRETMGQFLARASTGKFVRVHKSAIVNAAFISRMKPMHAGDCRLELSDGTVLRVSRTYREELRAVLGR
ncbi:LytR/AlgR family response regulator transcription factor [Oleiharenicola lentus]|uniref:LytR/AlgR family response regulator transcription factor n=1 Tax=Oleiharenicola lentus TaxID=2508720 RepID=UPI003F673979